MTVKKLVLLLSTVIENTLKEPFCQLQLSLWFFHLLMAIVLFRALHTSTSRIIAVKVSVWMCFEGRFVLSSLDYPQQFHFLHISNKLLLWKIYMLSDFFLNALN